jgi:hypothetical protein
MDMRFHKVSILLVVMALLAAACTASPAELPNTGNDLSPTISAVVTNAAPMATAVATGAAPLETQAPAVVNAARAWLATQTGVDISTLQVVSFEQTEWTDSCLGLGGPAESCLQVMTPGWRLVFRSGDKTYEVHTDVNGVNMRMNPVQ